MGRWLDIPAAANRTALQAAIVIALALTSLLIIYQLRQASAASDGPSPTVRSYQTGQTGSSSPASESSINGDSFNPAPADPQAAGNYNRTTINVNGQEITVPPNGSVSQTIDNGDGTTTVNAQSSSTSSTSQGGASSSNSSSVNVRVDSRSNDTEVSR